jgi:phytanoyl-CoA hydroxylase
MSTTDRIDVPKPLGTGQVRDFVNLGYVVVPGLVTAAEVDELRREAVAIARGRYPCDKIQPAPESASDDEVLRSFLCIHQPHHISPVTRRYAAHPKICGTLSQIVGAHLPFWDGSVKCMQSMLFVKGPGQPGQAWHQDEIYIPTRDRSLCGAWIALDDATVENGCLWVIPASHRSGYLYPQREHSNTDEFDFAPESYGFGEKVTVSGAGFSEAAEIPVEAPTGAVVFFNGYLLHRSKKNRSRGYRRALVNHYCTAATLLPWWLKEGESPANADRRNVFPVAGIDPYAWKGTEHMTDGVWIRPRSKKL